MVEGNARARNLFCRGHVESKIKVKQKRPSSAAIIAAKGIGLLDSRSLGLSVCWSDELDAGGMYRRGERKTNRNRHAGVGKGSTGLQNDLAIAILAADVE